MSAHNRRSNEGDEDELLPVRSFRLPHYIMLAVMGAMGAGGYRLVSVQKDDLAGRVEGTRAALSAELEPLNHRVEKLEGAVQDLSVKVATLTQALQDAKDRRVLYVPRGTSDAAKVADTVDRS